MKVARKRKGRKATPRTNSFQIGSPDAPEEGSDAGDARGLDEKYLRSVVSQNRATANRHYANAKRLVGHNRPEAEAEARRAIASIVRAFWWAEDTDLEKAQHELMHKIGRWTRSTFGCELHFDGEKYEQRCPIAIAHKRIGFSPGFTARHICSICGGDLSECPHLRSRLYWVRGGLDASGLCPVCVREQCDRHKPDRLYRAKPTSIVTDLQGLEVSLVPRPANPEARLLALPVQTQPLPKALGPTSRLEVSMPCDRCLGGCWGFDEVPYEDSTGPVGSVVDVRVSDEDGVTFDLEID
jgi:hypothetical protein